MKIDTIKSGDKTLAFVYLQNLDYQTAGTDKMGAVSNLSEDIEDTKIGYAGFHTKDALRDYLMKVVFDKTVEEKSVSTRHWLGQKNCACIEKTALSLSKGGCVKNFSGLVISRRTACAVLRLFLLVSCINAYTNNGEKPAHATYRNHDPFSHRVVPRDNCHVDHDGSWNACSCEQRPSNKRNLSHFFPFFCDFRFTA